VTRVGALKGRPADVRFVAATNRDLEREVARGAFRQDLFYRLSGFQIRVPALRERSADIEEIARGLLEAASWEAGYTAPPVLSPDALTTLTAYAWPGNVRELRNVIERAVLLCNGDVITIEHLPIDKMQQRVTTASMSLGGEGAQRPDVDPLQAAIDARERQRVESALARCGGNQTHAARLLGISRGTLLARMDTYGLTRPRKRTRE
jgi:DNA-binding NtrC family response regulator